MDEQVSRLPKIGAALEPSAFEAAHRRGARRAFRAALDFARRELRAASTPESTRRPMLD